MFRLINSHLQAHSLHVKSQDAVHTLGSQCVYISEDDYLLVETCSPHITLCNNKHSRADVQFFSITVRVLAPRDPFIQKHSFHCYITVSCCVSGDLL